MTKDARCILTFLAMVLFAPLLFGIAYLLWPVSYLAAITVLFVGFTIDILGGFEILDHTLSQT
jgi:fatty acid desaturase